MLFRSDEIGYLKELRRSEKSEEVADIRIRNLKDLVAALDRRSENLSNSPAERLQTFLEEVTLDADREEDETPKDTVTLITMHSCKGLEFPHVYVVGLEDGLLPHTRSKEEGTLDEERRLFYVAMTRAQETLTLSYCLNRKKFGNSEKRHPSPFLLELPDELVDRASEQGKKPVSVAAGKKLFSMIQDVIGD